MLKFERQTNKLKNTYCLFVQNYDRVIDDRPSAGVITIRMKTWAYVFIVQRTIQYCNYTRCFKYNDAFQPIIGRTFCPDPQLSHFPK